MTTPDIWTPLGDAEYRTVWDRCYRQFEFEASFYPSGWPGFSAPDPYVTFTFGAVEEGPSRGAAYDAVNGEGLRCFVTACPNVERWLVLDWQHEAYWFDAIAAAQHPQTWMVSVLPDGDYYSFLAPDMTVGAFGHPWEKTLCVFGAPLVDTLAKTLAAWLPVLRATGAPPS